MSVSEYDEFSDGSEEDYVPNSQEDSESENEDMPPKKKKKQCCCADKQCKSGRVSHAPKTIHASKNKSSTKKNPKAHGKEHEKYARNKTYASKVSCCDRHEVEDFLASTRCGCDGNCLHKLLKLKDDGGLHAVFNLRCRRFACTYTVPCSVHTGRQCICSDLVSHPGVKNSR